MGYEAFEIKDKKILSFLVEDRFRFWRHAGFLLGFFILIYNASFFREYSKEYQVYVLSFVYVQFVIIAYINIYLLVPYFFLKNRYLLYIILLIILVIVWLNFIGYFIETYFAQHKLEQFKMHIHNKGIYEGIIMCVPLIMVTTTIKLLQRWTKDNQRISDLRNLTLTMELNELRNQINPHFLFNMLNNVKALIRSNPEKATTVIIKLSEFLRYQLYENNEERTLLTSEIHFLSNFINLEKIRREDLFVNLDTTTDKRTLNNVFIPPNLFTTFVENAIKHSVDISGEKSYINISIEVENKKLHFVCSNSKNPDYPMSDKNYSGLGLANIKRRLELLYNDNYNLDISSTEKEYIVNLIIPV
jgi:sensor histidine kinase YesM